MLDRVGDRVGDQPHARPGRERVRAAAQVLLEDVVLGRALQLVFGDALVLGGDDVERQQPGRRRVDRHRGVHLVERDPVEQRAHVSLVRDRNADLAHLAPRELVIGVVPGLGRQVERDAQSGLSLGEVSPVQLIGPFCVGMAGVGPHHPRTITLGQAGGGSFRHTDRLLGDAFDRCRGRRLWRGRRDCDAPASRVRRRHRVRAGRADRRRLEPQHVPGCRVRRPFAPVRVLVRAKPPVVTAVRPPGRDSGLPRGHRRPGGRARPGSDRRRGAVGHVGRGAGEVDA